MKLLVYINDYWFFLNSLYDDFLLNSENYTDLGNILETVKGTIKASLSDKMVNSLMCKLQNKLMRLHKGEKGREWFRDR